MRSTESAPHEAEAARSTSPEEARVQREPRERTLLAPEAYWAFLAQFGDVDPEVLRRRRGPQGEPFRL